jgi:hypothetical protein
VKSKVRADRLRGAKFQTSAAATATTTMPMMSFVVPDRITLHCRRWSWTLRAALSSSIFEDHVSRSYSIHQVSTTSDEKTNPYRLSRAVVPSAYRLALEPNLEAATFTGSVDADVDIAEGVSTITLNAIELAISAASLDVGGRTVVSGAPVLDDQYETAMFTFDEELPVGPATLHLTFVGQLNDQLHGFYR